MSVSTIVVRAEDLELPAADLVQQINDAVFAAWDREQKLKMAEDFAPGRVHEGADGSIWILTPDSSPGVALRGWRLW